jgi:hypothetical protein
MEQQLCSTQLLSKVVWLTERRYGKIYVFFLEKITRITFRTRLCSGLSSGDVCLKIVLYVQCA